MLLSKRANDRIWDALLKEALIDSCNKELREIESEMENEKDIIDCSEKFEKKIKTLANSIGRKNALKTAAAVFRKTAAAAAVIIAAAFGVCLTQPDVYAAVGGAVKKIFYSHDNFFNADVNEEFDKNKQVGYIPDGYELRHIFYSDTNVSMSFEADDRTEFIVDYGFADNFSISADNKRYKCVELQNNNVDYYLYWADNSDENNVLVWYKDNYYYAIYAQISLYEFIKIAESIK